MTSLRSAKTPVFRRSAGIAKFFMVSMLMAGLLGSACTRAKVSSIRLPPLPILTGGLGWGLVSASHARLKLAPQSTAADSGTIRGGAVLELQERRFDREIERGGVYWYRVAGGDGSGWIHSDDVQVYDTKAQALAASAKDR